MYYIKNMLFSDAALFIDVKRKKKVCIFLSLHKFFDKIY